MAGLFQLGHRAEHAAPQGTLWEERDQGQEALARLSPNPAYAHHLRFAQPRAMSLKVSDEFTVPLCAGRHDALHKTGDERAWWARHGIIEPLKMAERLWTASRLGSGVGEIGDLVDELHPGPEAVSQSSGAQATSEP